jgi:ribonuclease E
VPELGADRDYLLALWQKIQGTSERARAPAQIHQDLSPLLRAVRDMFTEAIQEAWVDDEESYREILDFLDQTDPALVPRVKLFRRNTDLMAEFGIDRELEKAMRPKVWLKSGGYLVVNQTEALVAIDVNSGRATRDRHIEDTALRTNLEAADEVARQLRLRDLAGLVVIDFIDMESSKHDGMVERRMKDALKQDRARIQVGRISHFGLLEMSRQRLRPSLVEHAFIACPHCQGRGLVRSVESSGLAVLRAIEEEGGKRRAAEIVVHVATPIAFWLLNKKRERLMEDEQRFGMTIVIQPDDTLTPPAVRIERTRAQSPEAAAERQAALRMDYAPEPEEPEAEEMEEVEAPARAEAPAARAEGAEPRAEGEDGGRRRRRRRRRGRREGGDAMAADGTGEGADGAEEEGEDGAVEAAAEPAETEAEPDSEGETEGEAEGEISAEAAEEARRRRRGRRGGRRRRPDGEAPATAEAAEPPPPPAPAPAPAPVARRAPTPADPFAGQMDEILMAMEAAEQQAAERATRPRRQPEPAPAPEPVEAPVAPTAEAPAAPVAVEPVVVEPVAAEPAAAKPAVAEPVAAPAPVEAPAEPVAAAPAAPEPPAEVTASVAEAQPAAVEPVIGAPVAPIVLGTDAPAELPRKRGWWRK